MPRTAGSVFTLVLVEPGVPLLLGLRRTLAFQVVAAALGPDPAPRVAVLSLAAVGLALIARVLLRGWGRHSAPDLADASVARTAAARWPRAVGLNLVLGTWALLAWLPALAVMASALASASGDPAGGMCLSVGDFLHRLADPLARRLIANSAALGLAVVALDLAVAQRLPRFAGALAWRWPPGLRRCLPWRSASDR